MSKYTVVLLYPDYATGDYGADTYIATTEGETYEEATEAAQKLAEEANRDNDRCSTIPADDFRPIAVFAGDCVLEADATNF